MIKVKHVRTADCVVAGFRWHKSGGIVGSLLLGVFDDAGVLHHVGITASFTMLRRKELVDELAPYREGAEKDHPWPWAFEGTHSQEAAGRVPGAKSRWNAGKDLSFEPLRPELVCEVAYDHATTFKRWRPDRDPPSCTYAQFAVAVPHEVAAIFGAG
jgi:ATP-dependent DNA ligase